MAYSVIARITAELTRDGNEVQQNEIGKMFPDGVDTSAVNDSEINKGKAMLLENPEMYKITCKMRLMTVKE